MAFKVSTRARYALRMMLEITKAAKEGNYLDLGFISKKTGISRRYLEQLAISLKNAALVKGMAGRRGGYVLARSPNQISVGDIVEATIGPISITDCLDDDDACLYSAFCECHLIWGLVNYRIREILFKYTLEDLADKSCIQKLSSRLDVLIRKTESIPVKKPEEPGTKLHKLSKNTKNESLDST